MQRAERFGALLNFELFGSVDDTSHHRVFWGPGSGKSVSVNGEAGYTKMLRHLVSGDVIHLANCQRYKLPKGKIIEGARWLQLPLW